MNSSYCLGMSLTIEALKHRPDAVFKVVLSTKAIKNKQLDYLLELINKNHIDVIYDDKLINKLSSKENCYCIGFFKYFYNEFTSDNHIVLYGFNDEGELGTILRSSLSFNFKDIVLINSNIDYFDVRTVRASMGSIFSLAIKKYSTFIEYFKDYPYQNLYPFKKDGDIELKDIYLSKPFSLIISSDNNLPKDINEVSYYLYEKNKDISLSIRSSIILENIYQKNKSIKS